MNAIDHIYAINLDKDIDRWDNVVNEINRIDKTHQLATKLQRIQAIYGKNLSPDEQKALTTTFCNYFCSPSMIGCFLSHKKAWETMIKNGDKKAIIFEDDIKLTDDFKEQLNKALNELDENEPNWGMLYLGCYGGCDKDKKYNLFNTMVIKISNTFWIQNNGNKKQYQYSNQPDFPTGFHAYIITNKTAKLLLQLLSTINYHVDTEVIPHLEKINAYAMNNKIAYQNQIDYKSTQEIGYPIIIGNQLSKFNNKEKPDLHSNFASPKLYIKSLQQNLDYYLIIWFFLLFIITLIIAFFKIPLYWFNILIVLCVLYNVLEYNQNPNNLNRILLFLFIMSPFYIYLKLH